MTDPVAQIGRLFREHGGQHYDGARSEAVTALAHALQCAQLAEWAGAAPSLVAAAFLHDIGHFVANPDASRDVDDAHEVRALPLLRGSFGDEVVEPIRLHVQAKRYLVRADPRYLATLSPASVHSLRLQGGAMSAGEAASFEGLAHASAAVDLRRWDDCAKTPGRATPPLDYYLALLEETRVDA